MGAFDGEDDGTIEIVGWKEGVLVGFDDGDIVGVEDGVEDGVDVGDRVGPMDGPSDGSFDTVGRLDIVGFIVGDDKIALDDEAFFLSLLLLLLINK